MNGEPTMNNTPDVNEEGLVVLWSSRDADVARELVFPDVLNSKLRGWWDDVILIVWGPSQITLCEQEELQDYLAKIIEAGVRVEACLACSDNYGLSDGLSGLGIDVKYMGAVTTEYLKAGKKVLTF